MTSVAAHSLQQADVSIIADALSQYARTMRDQRNSAFDWNSDDRIDRCIQLEALVLRSDGVSVHGNHGLPAPTNVANTRYRPISPDLYVPDSLLRVREKAANAIEREVRSRKLTSVEIAHHMPTIRKADIDRYLQGYGALFAEKKQFQIAEAVGLRFSLSVKGAS